MVKTISILTGKLLSCASMREDIDLEYKSDYYKNLYLCDLQSSCIAVLLA